MREGSSFSPDGVGLTSAPGGASEFADSFLAAPAGFPVSSAEIAILDWLLVLGYIRQQDRSMRTAPMIFSNTRICPFVSLVQYESFRFM